MEFEHCAKTQNLSGNKVVKRIRWEKPEQGWAKLNSDGASSGNPGPAGCGSLIRNEKGEWIVGFARKIGVTNNFIAELWGLRDGLIQCPTLSLSAVEIEINAKAIVKLLANPSYYNHVVSPLVDDCRSLLSHIPQTRIKHCYQEANRCTDVLARLGITQVEDFRLFSSPPMDAIHALSSNANGLYLTRLCL